MARSSRKGSRPPLDDFGALWAAVVAAPYDEAPRLVLADWLAERGLEPELERGLRSRAVIVASVSCKYRRAALRSAAVLTAVREMGRVRLLTEYRRTTPMYANGGTFKGKITNWGLTESKQKKTEQFYVQFQIVCQVVDDEEVACPSSEQTIYRPITDNTIDYLVEDLKNLGFTGTDFALLDRETPGAHDFEGKEFLARCVHEEYQGKTQERWSFAWAGGGIAALDKSGLSKLNQRFGAKLKQAMAGAAKNGPTAPPAQRPKTTAEQLEEVL